MPRPGWPTSAGCWRWTWKRPGRHWPDLPPARSWPTPTGTSAPAGGCGSWQTSSRATRRCRPGERKGCGTGNRRKRKRMNNEGKGEEHDVTGNSTGIYMHLVGSNASDSLPARSGWVDVLAIVDNLGGWKQPCFQPWLEIPPCRSSGGGWKTQFIFSLAGRHTLGPFQPGG